MGFGVPAAAARGGDGVDAGGVVGGCCGAHVVCVGGWLVAFRGGMDLLLGWRGLFVVVLWLWLWRDGGGGGTYMDGDGWVVEGGDKAEDNGIERAMALDNWSKQGDSLILATPCCQPRVRGGGLDKERAGGGLLPDKQRCVKGALTARCIVPSPPHCFYSARRPASLSVRTGSWVRFRWTPFISIFRTGIQQWLRCYH